MRLLNLSIIRDILLATGLEVFRAELIGWLVLVRHRVCDGILSMIGSILGYQRRWPGLRGLGIGTGGIDSVLVDSRSTGK